MPRTARLARDRRLFRGVAAIAITVALAGGMPQAFADNVPAESPVVDELLRKIDERDQAIATRDAAIDDLAARVKALETQVGALKAEQQSNVALANQAGNGVIVDLLRRVETLEQQRRHGFPVDQAGGQAGLPSPALVEAVHKVAWPAAPGRRVVRSVADEPPASSEPGALAVDEDAAERALERSLTQSGALLLEPGHLEIEPSFQYLRRDIDGPLLVTVGADTVVSATRLRTHEFEGALDFRIGLPWDSQVELGVPVRHVSETSSTTSASSSGGLSFAASDDDATGIGDVRIGLAKTLVREEGWRPDLIARVEWDSDTGQDQSGISLGTGFDEITGSIVALKRQDPLAFTAKIGYRATLENDGIDPGDELIFSLGANLAASPSTSLSATLDQSFAGEIEVGGVTIAGSDQVVSTLTLGVSTVLDRGVLLTLSGGFGLTEDSPDYFVGLALPISLEVPTP